MAKPIDIENIKLISLDLILYGIAFTDEITGRRIDPADIFPDNVKYQSKASPKQHPQQHHQ